jgi:hypothetical protein
MPPASCFLRRATWLALLLALAGPAHAALQDEIQVYDDSINDPKEVGLELHVNATPSSRVKPAYPGEVTSLHGLRLTGEFSYGVTPSFELGLYVPTVYDNNGDYKLAGLKARAKWMPLRPDKVNGGWFAGANVELAKVRYRYDEATTNSEVKLISGWRNKDWLLAGNLNFENAWTGPDARHRPELGIALKATREVAPGLAPGLEYYVGTGPIGHVAPANDQERVIYAVLDVDIKPFVFNVGIGRGLTDASDKWTLKAIFEIPLSR